MFNSKLEFTEHNIETNFAADHLGPFYLTDLLMDNIKASKEGRIIIAASLIHEMLQGEIDIDDVFDRKLDVMYFGAGFIQYAKAKVCQMYFTMLLAKKLKEANVTNVKAVCLHPGVVNSRFMEAMFDRFPCPGFRCFFFCSVGIFYLWVSQICFKTNK
jgi:NAD(P)-dependent dehydrogenase (short-subunit alcohol dehydrogenase family)